MWNNSPFVPEGSCFQISKACCKWKNKKASRSPICFSLCILNLFLQQETKDENRLQNWLTSFTWNITAVRCPPFLKSTWSLFLPGAALLSNRRERCGGHSHVGNRSYAGVSELTFVAGTELWTVLRIVHWIQKTALWDRWSCFLHLTVEKSKSLRTEMFLNVASSHTTSEWKTWDVDHW